MPLYEYECEACGHHLEAQQRLADAPLTKCPECGKKKLQKLISATAFHLKGGGWYKDLYSSQKPDASSSSDSEGSAGSSPASETKPDAKAETKPDPTKKADKKKGGSGSSSSGSGGGGGAAKKPAKGGSSASASV